jgi:ABC-type cobalamin/Fe3+-siderophores transport system ATPase subunit
MTTVVADKLVLERGRTILLQGLSLSLGPSGSIAVIGPNGAGKSMLLKVLAGLVQPTSGQVRIDDRTLSSLSGRERSQTIAYLPQNFEPHWDLRVADFVRLGAERGSRPDAGTIEDALIRFELASIRDRRWSTLSGGERARVLLAMVLAPDPPVLLADEPGASLDVRHRLDMVEALLHRATPRLSVVVMHDLDLAFRFFERVIVLNGGRIVADGPAGELVYDLRLDAAFGVKFERFKTPDGVLLHAS